MPIQEMTAYLKWMFSGTVSLHVGLQYRPVTKYTSRALKATSL